MSVSLAEKSRASDGGGTIRSVCPLGSLLEKEPVSLVLKKLVQIWFFAEAGSILILPFSVLLTRSAKMDAQELFVSEMQFSPLKVRTANRGANFASQVASNLLGENSRAGSREGRSKEGVSDVRHLA